MSVGSISTLPPVLQQITQAQPQNSQKPTTQAAAQPVSGSDSDGDNDGSGSGSVNITPPVSIKA